MSGILQSPFRTTAWVAALHLALAATHAPCTFVVDVVFIRRMLPLSLSQHAAALPPYPHTTLIPFPSRPLAAYCHYLAVPPPPLMHPLRERFSMPSVHSTSHSPPAYASPPQLPVCSSLPRSFHPRVHRTLDAARLWLYRCLHVT